MSIMWIYNYLMLRARGTVSPMLLLSDYYSTFGGANLTNLHYMSDNVTQHQHAIWPTCSFWWWLSVSPHSSPDSLSPCVGPLPVKSVSFHFINKQDWHVLFFLIREPIKQQTCTPHVPCMIDDPSQCYHCIHHILIELALLNVIIVLTIFSKNLLFSMLSLYSPYSHRTCSSQCYHCTHHILIELAFLNGVVVLCLLSVDQTLQILVLSLHQVDLIV